MGWRSNTDPNWSKSKSRPDPEPGLILRQTKKKVYVKDVEVTVQSERISYLDQNGNLITESIRDFSRKTVRSEFASLDL